LIRFAVHAAKEDEHIDVMCLPLNVNSQLVPSIVRCLCQLAGITNLTIEYGVMLLFGFF
jgi:hypothetical protein